MELMTKHGLAIDPGYVQQKLQSAQPQAIGEVDVTDWVWREPADMIQAAGRVGILHIGGPIAWRPDWLQAIMGGSVPNGELAAALDYVATDPTYEALVIEFDCPGGDVCGIADILGALHRVQAAGKPVVAFVHEAALSLGYWIASQCDLVVGTPTCQVGSIGIMAVIMDVSKSLEKDGVAASVVTTAEHKAGFHPALPVTDTEREELLRLLEPNHDMFVQAIADGRGMPVEAVHALATGQIMTVQQALSGGLLDGVVQTAAVLPMAESLMKGADMSVEGRAAAVRTRAASYLASAGVATPPVMQAGGMTLAQLEDEHPDLVEEIREAERAKAAADDKPDTDDDDKPEPEAQSNGGPEDGESVKGPAVVPTDPIETEELEGEISSAAATVPSQQAISVATLEELRQTFPKDPEFAMKAACAGWSVMEAKANYADVLQNRLDVAHASGSTASDPERPDIAAAASGAAEPARDRVAKADGKPDAGEYAEFTTYESLHKHFMSAGSNRIEAAAKANEARPDLRTAYAGRRA